VIEEAVIEEALGRIDCDARGSGPTVVLVPGSCSTGAAWRPVIAAWDHRFRSVTTSLLGYGGTAERRTASDTAIAHEAGALESVVRSSGGRVHLVGHSFGGLVALAVALRNRVPLASLTIIEAPATEILREPAQNRHYRAFLQMTDVYFAAFERGEAEAIATMIDFYGGAGTFVSWPMRVRAYAIETTPTNILDWATARDFPLAAESLAVLQLPTLVLLGSASHSAVRRANVLLGERIKGATVAAIDGAAHFMTTTHSDEVARLIAMHVDRAEERLRMPVQ
jgi:pimeloyl-ACP methyl ester carboxylesterase